MVLAVLQQHVGIRLAGHDVFASTVGGARLAEPASDLAVAVALASATFDIPPPAGVVAMGEIGLAGELRRVRDLRNGSPRQPGWGSRWPWCRPSPAT